MLSLWSSIQTGFRIDKDLILGRSIRRRWHEDEQDLADIREGGLGQQRHKWRVLTQNQEPLGSVLYAAEDYHQDYLSIRTQVDTAITNYEIAQLELFAAERGGSGDKGWSISIEETEENYFTAHRRAYNVVRKAGDRESFSENTMDFFERESMMSWAVNRCSYRRINSTLMGWPAFTRPIRRSMVYLWDTTFGMERVEVVAKGANFIWDTYFRTDQQKSGAWDTASNWQLKIIPVEDMLEQVMATWLNQTRGRITMKVRQWVSKMQHMQEG